MPRRDAEGRLVRPPRDAVPTVSTATVEGCAEHALFWIGNTANLAGYCMSDNLDDPAVIRDCHDIIGSVAAAGDAIRLLLIRARDLAGEG